MPSPYLTYPITEKFWIEWLYFTHTDVDLALSSETWPKSVFERYRSLADAGSRRHRKRALPTSSRLGQTLRSTPSAYETDLARGIS